MTKQRRRRGSASLVVRETQVRSTRSYHLTAVRVDTVEKLTTVGEAVEKLEPIQLYKLQFHPVGVIVKWCSYYAKQ